MLLKSNTIRENPASLQDQGNVNLARSRSIMPETPAAILNNADVYPEYQLLKSNTMPASLLDKATSGMVTAFDVEAPFEPDDVGFTHTKYEHLQ